jgi:hypothetical protein
MADQIHVFLRKNRHAWQFAYKASQDYLLTRLGMLNGQWSSFEMATQAIEKLLKSYLLFTDSTLAGDADKVFKAVSAKAKTLGRTHEHGHDVEAALDLATANGLPSSVGLATRVVRINGYYAHRYPRIGAGYPTAGLSTAEISDVDEALFAIWDAFKAIHPDYYYVTGIMTSVYGKLACLHGGHDISALERDFDILTLANKSYEARRSDIETAITERLTSWFPRKSALLTPA